MPQTGPNPTYVLSYITKTAILGQSPHYETQTSGFVQNFVQTLQLPFVHLRNMILTEKHMTFDHLPPMTCHLLIQDLEVFINGYPKMDRV